MGIEQRVAPRFRDFARAKIGEMCCLSGFLEDVSKTGCRVRFSHALNIDLDREYTLTVLPALRSGIKEFELTVKPCWFESSADSFEVGFHVLPSPAIRSYTKYVDILAELEEAELQEA